MGIIKHFQSNEEDDSPLIKHFQDVDAGPENHIQSCNCVGMTKKEFFKLIGAHPDQPIPNLIWLALKAHNYKIIKSK